MALKDHNIIKLAASIRHSLFLEDNGDVWFCGRIPYKLVSPKPKMMGWLDAKIIDIDCGETYVGTGCEWKGLFGVIKILNILRK